MTNYEIAKKELLAKGYTLTVLPPQHRRAVIERDNAHYERGIGDTWAKPRTLEGRRVRPADPDKAH